MDDISKAVTRTMEFLKLSIPELLLIAKFIFQPQRACNTAVTGEGILQQRFGKSYSGCQWCCNPEPVPVVVNRVPD